MEQNTTKVGTVVNHALQTYLIFCAVHIFLHLAAIHFEQSLYPATTDLLWVNWFIKCWCRCLNLTAAKATQSQTSEAISDACLHLSHSGLSTRVQFLSCPFKWQCHVSRPVPVHSLFLIRLSISTAFFFSKGSFKKALRMLLPMHWLLTFLMILHAPYLSGCWCLLNNEDYNFFAFYEGWNFNSGNYLFKTDTK